MTSNVNQSESSDPNVGNADTLRATEVSRLRSLVDTDMETAEQLHAEDFQLITPGGSALSKAEYLNGVASGVLDYVVWKVDSPIDVRLFDGVAILRYRSILHMIYHGMTSDQTNSGTRIATNGGRVAGKQCGPKQLAYGDDRCRSTARQPWRITAEPCEQWIGWNRSSNRV